MKFIIMLIILFLVSSAYARDPDVLPHDDYYNEHTTVGGSAWSGGDTFICIALPVAVILTLALPHVFDGKYECWPVWKFETKFRTITSVRLSCKFPTRQRGSKINSIINRDL